MRILVLFLVINFACSQTNDSGTDDRNTIIQDDRLLTYEIDVKTSELKFYYKNEKNENFRNHKRLRSSLEKNNKELIFAVNGGMYNKDLSPQGLYIEDGKIINKLSIQKEGYGNFYLQPNGVFYIDQDRTAGVVTTDRFNRIATIKYATQSGPMLVIEGKIHAKFRKGSKNLHIRNGVGLLPNGNLLFVMSKEKINFYDLAEYFKNNNCKNALYLDGFVSRTYLPSKKWIQEDGNFGVIIGEVK